MLLAHVDKVNHFESVTVLESWFKLEECYLNLFWFTRQNLGRPGIPGSKDLDAALKRLSLRRQNEASEKEYELRRERHESQQSTDTLQSDDKSHEPM